MSDSNTGNNLLHQEIVTIGAQLGQAKQSGRVLNEAETELYVINPLLRVLGYVNLAEIAKQSHDKIAKTYPDYTLLPNTPHEWFLEVKRLDLPLQDGEAAQTVSYASNRGASWAVLTNGRTWYFYLAHLKKPLNEKRVFQIDDLFAQTDAAERLALLSLPSMTTGGLDEAWQAKQLHALIHHELITPQSTTRKTLRRLAVQETGSAAISDGDIGRVLQTLFAIPANPASLLTPASVPPAALPPTPSPMPLTTPPSLPPGDWKTLDELRRDSSLSANRKPARVLLANKNVQAVKSWGEFAQYAIQFLGETYGLPPLPFALKGRGVKYLLSSEPLRSDKQIKSGIVVSTVSGQKVYLDNHRTASDIAATLFALLNEVNAPLDSVLVEVA